MRATLVIGMLALLPALGDLQQPPAPGAAQRPASSKMIVVSLQRIANESSDGRAATQRLQALLQKMTQDLAAKQKELPPNGPEFQRLALQSQQEYGNAQRQAQAELKAKLAPIISQIAAQRGVDVILNADTTVWNAPALDVTSEVIMKLDGK